MTAKTWNGSSYYGIDDFRLRGIDVLDFSSLRNISYAHYATISLRLDTNFMLSQFTQFSSINYMLEVR